MDPTLLADLQRLIDKDRIFQLSLDYCRAFDRLDWDLLRSIYHHDATDDRGVFRGPSSQFIEFSKTWLEAVEASHFKVSNPRIEVEGDVAFGEIYHLVHFRLIEGPSDLIFAGRYFDRYERRDGVWKIAHRHEINDWSRTVPASDRWRIDAPDALHGIRSRDDVTYHRDALHAAHPWTDMGWTEMDGAA